MFFSKTQRTPTFRLKAAGLVFLLTASVVFVTSILAMQGSDMTVEQTPRRPGVKVIPRDQSKIVIPPRSADRTGEASILVLDEDGNRTSPATGSNLSPELKNSISPKTQFSYRVEQIPEGYRRFIPNTPIRSFSRASVDEDHEVTYDCLTGPEELYLSPRSPIESEREVVGE